LHHLLAAADSVACNLGVVKRVRHGLLAITILACPHHLGQDPGVLVIAGADHYRIQFSVGQQFFGILKRLRTRAKQFVSIRGGSFAVDGPEIADAAEIEFRVRCEGFFEHLAVAAGPMPTADLTNLNSIVRTDDPCIGSRRKRQCRRDGSRD